MTTYDSSTLGADGIDVVGITVGGRKLKIAKSYEVRTSLFEVPAAFALRVGHAETIAELTTMFQPGTAYQLKIGDVLQQTGRIDGYEVSGSGGSDIAVRGRDALARLHDAHAVADSSFNQATYPALTTKVLEAVGYENFGIASSNEANRKAITGAAVVQTANPDEADKDVPHVASTHNALRVKVGENWYDFLRKQLDKGGLFFWAAGDGTFVLSTPNTKQEPVSRIVRRRGSSDGRNPVNVLSAQHKNDATGRFSEAVIYGRGGGGDKLGRVKQRGAFVDDEMKRWGYSQSFAAQDELAVNIAAANFIARRKIAETRRKGWQLVYTVAGHSTPAIKGGARAIWTPDTMIEVLDDELGIHGNFYLEGCDYRRDQSSGTTTTLTLVRPDDLVFGAPPQ